MAEKEKVIQVIFSAIDEVNQDYSEEEQLEKSVDTALVGESGTLDSLGVVTLITAVEQGIEDEFDAVITLADEDALSGKSSPFATINSLADYILSLMEENQVT